MFSLLRISTFTFISMVGAGAFAQKTPKIAPLGGRIEPVCYQRILRMYSENGQKKLELGPRIPYHPKSEFSPAADSLVAYDAFEPDPAKFPATVVPGENPSYGSSCGINYTNGERWYFGDDSTTGVNSYNDMQVASSDANGVRCKRAAFAWNIYNNGVSDTVINNMSVIVATCENFDLSTTGGPFDNGVNGRGDLDRYLFQFGTYVQHPFPNGGYKYAEINLTLPNDGWRMPTDGSGGYFVSVGDFNTGTNVWTTDIAQNMLWGTKIPALQGSQSQLQFDDDNLKDGIWSANELVQYNLELCPDPLGPMAAFWYGPVQLPVTLVPNTLTILLGDNDNGETVSSLAADDDIALKICKGFVPNLASPKVRFECDFGPNPYSLPSQIRVDMKAHMTTGGVFVTRVYLADRTGGSFGYTAGELVVNAAINTIFVNYSGDAGGTLSRYTDSGTMRTRVEVSQAGFSAATIPCAEFEKLNVTVTP